MYLNEIANTVRTSLIACVLWVWGKAVGSWWQPDFLHGPWQYQAKGIADPTDGSPKKRTWVLSLGRKHRNQLQMFPANIAVPFMDTAGRTAINSWNHSWAWTWYEITEQHSKSYVKMMWQKPGVLYRDCRRRTNCNRLWQTKLLVKQMLYHWSLEKETKLFETCEMESHTCLRKINILVNWQSLFKVAFVVVPKTAVC